MSGRSRPSMAMCRHHRGFTLLEMLVVLIVLGFLMLGLNQGVRTGLGFWTVQSRQIGNTAELDTTARILRMLLTGLPIAPAAAINPGAAPMALSFAGAADHLTFVGDLPTGLGNTHRADITIELPDGLAPLHFDVFAGRAGGEVMVFASGDRADGPPSLCGSLTIERRR